MRVKMPDRLGPRFNRVACGWIIGFMLAFPCYVPAAADAADSVTARGSIDDDYYAAGGVVDIDADVAGDVIAAGGTLRLRGIVEDDVRVAGGDIVIDTSIGDDLAASGGSVLLSGAASVGGNAWLAGGEVQIAGTVDGNLRVIAADITLSGRVRGDVELEGGDIQILESARIDGNLLFHGPRPVITDFDTQVGGQVSYERGETEYGDRGFGLFFSITLVVASILFYLMFPQYTVASVRRIRTDPFTSLGLGFIFLVATPVLAFFSMIIVLGLWVGLSVLALYCVAVGGDVLAGHPGLAGAPRPLRPRRSERSR